MTMLPVSSSNSSNNPIENPSRSNSSDSLSLDNINNAPHSPAEPDSFWNGKTISLVVFSALAVVVSGIAIALLFTPIGAGILATSILIGCAVLTGSAGVVGFVALVALGVLHKKNSENAQAAQTTGLPSDSSESTTPAQESASPAKQISDSEDSEAGVFTDSDPDLDPTALLFSARLGESDSDSLADGDQSPPPSPVSSGSASELPFNSITSYYLLQRGAKT